MYVTIKNHLINMLGWKTSRKIVVFESDDWGSLRMPSKKSYDSLLKGGIRVDQSQYDSLDSLEKKEDIEALTECLYKYRNSNGGFPIFTLNTVMGNPDFEAIRKDNFNQFFYQPFFQSYQQYYGQDLRSVWAEGMENKLIKPQFHAREHLNIQLWMKDLIKGNNDVRLAFDHGFYGLKTQTSSKFQRHYLSAYRVENKQELLMLQNILVDGLFSFNTIFGFKSQSFIACNYTWPAEIEPFLKTNGIDFLQGQRGQIVPILNQDKIKIKHHFTGQVNKEEQRFLVRNVLFEPYLNQHRDWVNTTLKGISNAFFWKTPAIISTHRINYASNMSISNRDSSLSKLECLLGCILKKWPDVVFMTSDEIGKAIIHENSHS